MNARSHEDIPAIVEKLTGRTFKHPDLTLLNGTREPRWVVGEAVDYGSIYGYPKRKIMVYRINPGQVAGQAEKEYVKEELIVNENGEIAGVCYYRGSFNRPSGKLRFYSSPEAFLIACGNQLMDTGEPNPTKKRGVKRKAKKARKAKAKPRKSTRKPARKQAKAKKRR